jgi:predicted HTH transcriptional regulator
MNDEQFAILVEFGAEQRNVEFKGPGKITDKHHVHRVVRAILGMTNRQDGGFVAVGVMDNNGSLDPVGMEVSILTGWTLDNLADKAAPLVDPSVHFDLEQREYKDRKFVLITVREFDETPVFCRVTRNNADNTDVVLREGALYVRSRRKPETIEIRTAQEMRDLLDLALRKRIRHFLDLSQSAGLATGPVQSTNSAVRYKEQLGDLGF